MIRDSVLPYSFFELSVENQDKVINCIYDDENYKEFHEEIRIEILLSRCQEILEKKVKEFKPKKKYITKRVLVNDDE